MPHTPGPWKVMQGVVRPRVSTADGSTTVAGNICSLGNAEIGEANARLIAAAPDLLAACKFIIWAVSTDGTSGVRFLEACNSARQAIAKAEGK